MKKNIVKIAAFFSFMVNIFLIGYIFTMANSAYGSSSRIAKQRVVEATETIPDRLDEWGMFTMALMKVESDYDSTAVSNKGAKGYFQITPIYVKEVNRIHNTNYTMKDVFSLDSAYQIFDLMQQAHNKNYDMDKALTLHNGNHKWYKKRVMNAYEDIKKYEEIRNRLIRL